jgi:hypothetical protein
MAKFIVTVTRTVHQTMDIEVEASDEDDAFAVGEDEAGNHDFTGKEKEARYEVISARPKA